MSQYCSPELFVGGLEILSLDSVSFKESGGTTINSLTVKLTDPVFEEYKWYNQKVEFFLNYGATDSIPLFRGFVRQINPSDKAFGFTALDPRTLLTGKEATPITITDNDNFDGFTLVQFMHKYISDNINVNETLIGLDMLNETDPPVLLKGIRAENSDPYKLITNNLPINKQNIKKPYKYSIKMVEGKSNSNIVVNRERDIQSDPAVEFSFYDGIQKLSYKRRPPAQFYKLATKDKSKSIVYRKGNMSMGPIGANLKGEYKDTDEALQAAILDSIIKEDEIQEVTMSITKGHYIGTGNLVKLNVEETELRKTHRVKSRTLSWSPNKGAVSNLVLNKDVPTSREYF